MYDHLRHSNGYANDVSVTIMLKYMVADLQYYTLAYDLWLHPCCCIAFDDFASSVGEFCAPSALPHQPGDPRHGRYVPQAPLTPSNWSALYRGRGSPVMSLIFLKANNGQLDPGVGDKRFFRFKRNALYF